MRKKLISTAVALALTGITLSAFADNFCGFTAFLEHSPAGTRILEGTDNNPTYPTADGVSLADQVSEDKHSFAIPGSWAAGVQQSDIKVRYGTDDVNYCDVTLTINKIESVTVNHNCNGNFDYASIRKEGNVYWLSFKLKPVLSDKA